MKGNYKTKDGSKVEVLDFDEANKMVRTTSGWVGEPEYKDWESLDTDEEKEEEVTEELETSEEETHDDVKEAEDKPKRKRTPKPKE